MSAAEMAVAAMPGRPMLRTARVIASLAPVTSNVSRPASTGPSISVPTAAAAPAA